MKNKILATLMLLSLAISVFAFGLRTSPVSAVTAQLSIKPAIVNRVPTDVNSFFDVFVELNIPDGPKLFGFDIKVTWPDNTLIQIDAATSNTSSDALLDSVWPLGWFFVKSEASGGGGGSGAYRLVALSTSGEADYGVHNLIDLHFKIMRYSNVQLQTAIHIDASFKLSDKNWTPIPATTFDGLFVMAGSAPDLEFELIDLTPSKPFEYCKTFYVKVWVTHITGLLKDYNFTIRYTEELLKLTGVDWTDGVLGGTSDQASYTETVPGTIHIVDTGGLYIYTGPRGLLFTLTFHIEFDSRIEHIWRVNAAHQLNAQIWFQDATLSFEDGDPIPIGGIAMPLPVPIVVNLIQGDVSCDGKVDIDDLRAVAASYDQATPTKYDLTMDGIIDIFDLVVVATKFWYGYP